MGRWMLTATDSSEQDHDHHWHGHPQLARGMTVALVSLSDIRLGVPIALAIAIHNIPEGVACSVPSIVPPVTGENRAFCLSWQA